MKIALKRLVCCVKGHRPFPKREILPVPPVDSGLTILGHAATGSFLSASGSWVTPAANLVTDNQGLHLHVGPVISTAFVCSRCYGVVWNTKSNPAYFANSNNIPELADYRSWQERQTWEIKQRAKNELADKLYKQYQVALKLCHVSGENDDAA